mgnify:FL=1
MDKNSIKKFAVWARRELITRVSQRAVQYEITEKGYGEYDADSVNGRVMSASEKSQRKALIDQIRAKGYEQVMEEVAYTWFNRFSALRFMEVNGYLPSRTRVFTDDNNNFKPQIITDAIDLTIDGLDMEKVYELKDDARKEEELYKYLLITQCNALSKVLPGMFQKISDYTELLFPDNLLREGSVINQMISMIDEEDWKEQVEIIGWLYQYYISVKHEQVVDVHKKKAVSKENLPAATQIFTTDWVVKYMVENSIGKYYVLTHPTSKIKEKMSFYIESEESISDKNINLESMTFLDSCMGSGHVLAYAFDLYLEMYREQGYTDSEAVRNIISKNLYGIDIDERAYQLASFSIAMKACSVDKRFLKKNIELNLIAIPESDYLHLQLCKQFIDDEYFQECEYIVHLFKNAKEYGSLIKPERRDYEAIYDYLNDYKLSNEPNIEEMLFVDDELPLLKKLVKATIILSQQYNSVCTNPPYHNKYDSALEKFVLDNYRNAKADLYSVFIIRNLEFCKKDGYSGMMTPHGWMFTKSYEEVRRKVIDEKSISTLIHMAKGAFYSEAAVDICSFVLRNHNSEETGTYLRLERFKGDMDVQKDAVLSAINSSECNYRYIRNSLDFHRIEGCPISYWVSERVYRDFELGIPMGKISPARQGMATTNNDRFLRMWTEVPFSKIGYGYANEDESAESGRKFFPYNKGGESRRWYGNNYFVVNFGNHGKELCDYIDVTAAPKFNHKNRVINRQYYFRESITWSDVGEFTSRYCPQGFIFDIKGSSGFPPKDKMLYILGILNSQITRAIIDILNPTISTQVGDMSRIPIIYGNEDIINKTVKTCVDLAKKIWDSHEMSWDFKKHPLLAYNSNSIETCYEQYKEEYSADIKLLHENEVLLNKLLFEIYGLTDMIDDYPFEDNDFPELSVESCIKEFISYSIGCMFGRYSLDKEGLVFAGGNINSDDYVSYPIDLDNIIPICDDEYFSDDIVAKFIDFVKKVFGEDKLEENLQFISNAIGGKGSSKDAIRSYFISKFYNDHCAEYSYPRFGQRPIYWLFDSGKNNGFKCLIYMHRYQPDTIARIRTDYVHEQQSRYRTALADIEQRLMGASGSEKVKLDKQKATLQAQITEIGEYEEKIHHLADQMIRIDFDDGVKNNYEIFKDVLAKIK